MANQLLKILAEREGGEEGEEAALLADAWKRILGQDFMEKQER